MQAFFTSFFAVVLLWVVVMYAVNKCRGTYIFKTGFLFTTLSFFYLFSRHSLRVISSKWDFPFKLWLGV